LFNPPQNGLTIWVIGIPDDTAENFLSNVRVIGEQIGLCTPGQVVSRSPFVGIVQIEMNL
jgi:hypothetical protein